MSSNSVSSPTRSAKDAESTKTKSPDRQERKVIPLDMKLENRLNMKDLERLQDAFLTEGEGYDNRLSLNKSQFCEAMSLLLKKGNRDEYADLFDKIDVTREGTVDWDKFASHMLLEFYEKDDRAKSTQVPQWRDLKSLPSPHKEVIQRVAYLKNTNRYVAISKEGSISMWGMDLKGQRSIKTGTDSCKARDLWVTHFVPLQNLNKIALAFTSKEIAIYDLGSKMEFNCQYKVQDLPFTPLCLDYWSNPNNVNEAVLAWGDVGGFINILFFSSANIALFERPPAPAGEKQAWQEPCLNVRIADIVSGRYKNATYTKYEGHREKAKGEWVRAVHYSQHLEGFISCATTTMHAVVIGWMEKHTSVSQTVDVNKGSQPIKKEILRQSDFTISQGVNSFDYSDRLNLIATAGVNNHVCLWNPYVVSKPSGVLRGHMASVVQVQFITTRGQLISFSKDKVLRVWDVQLQVCIQRLAGMFPKGPEVMSTLFFDEGRDRSGVERNRLFITFNYQLTCMDMKVEIKDRVMSHEKPVIAALYNTVYNQVVSVCQGGSIIIWLIDTGQKVKQFNGCHGNSEVTCITQDQSETRLYTGSTDGTVKVWDFNGHCYHSLECAGGQPADVGQILVLKRSVLVVGWAKFVTVFRNNNFRDYHVQPADWKGGQGHSEDILCMAFQGPSVLATASYDGEIVIWNTNSEQASRHLNQRMRKRGMTNQGRALSTKEKSQLAPVSEMSDKDSIVETGSTAESRSKSQLKSRVQSRISQSSTDQAEFSTTVAKLLFLESRKGNSAGGGANLVSCGGNGWVRFWNSSKNVLLAEFIAHPHAGTIIMATDKRNQWLVTGDVDGLVKVWDIIEYCTHHSDTPCLSPPPLKTQYQAHQDMVNSLDLCERNDRPLIISASSDCSVALWDVYGNKIGVFGQEEHWKIEQYDPTAMVEEEEEVKDDLTEKVDLDIEVSDDDSEWMPDEKAISEPHDYRLNTWNNTYLGKDYQALRVRKRERRQPGTIPNLPYLHWEKTGASPAGPYSALETQELDSVSVLVKPDPEKYFQKQSGTPDQITKLPELADTLNTAYDEKSLFPKYILDYEKRFHDMVKHPSQTTSRTLRTNFQNIGLGVNQLSTKPSPRKPGRGQKLKPLATRSSSISVQD